MRTKDRLFRFVFVTAWQLSLTRDKIRFLGYLLFTPLGYRILAWSMPLDCTTTLLDPVRGRGRRALRARWAVVEPLCRRPHRRMCNAPLACPRTRIICENPRHDHAIRQTRRRHRAWTTARTHTHLHLYSLRLRVGHPAQPTAASSLSLSTPDDTSPALHCTSCTTSPLSKRHCFHHMRDPIVLSRRASARGGRVASVRSCGRAHADLPLCPPRPLG